jgi:hypothetical protein
LFAARHAHHVATEAQSAVGLVLDGPVNPDRGLGRKVNLIVEEVVA